MNTNHEEDEFVAVRVQDPRVQNEGSWNSYVDYKIFLHTNSKAFTAKTSCVRRRYSEFVWLKKKLQKNAGLVPVPDLPGKSFFSFNSEDFLERRRKGLQAFLDKVVHTTVCLSDSQLHLFLQTQLPVGMIQDCVQGHTPYSVTDAILTYASSNWGFAQAQTQEDDAIKEPILTVSYESMESPAPHQPCLQPKDTFTPELLSCGDSDSVDIDAADDGDESQREDRPRSSVRVSQKNNRLEAVVECDCAPTEVAFFLGDDRDDGERLNSTGCRIQTPVEVHSPMEALFEEERSVTTLETEGKTQTDTLGETNVDESEKRVNSVQILDVKGSEEVVCSEVNGLDHVDVSDEKDPEIQVNPLVILDFKKSDSDDQVVENKPRFQIDQNHVVSEVNGVDDETTLQSEIRLETEEEEGGDVVQQMDQNRIKQDDDVISRSLASSNESIVKVSDEENEDSIQIREDDDDDRNILDLQVNGCSVGKHDEDLRFISPLNLDLNSAADGADLSGSGDFSVLESSSSVSVVNDVKRSDQETLPPASSLDGADETRQVLTVNKTVN